MVAENDPNIWLLQTAAAKPEPILDEIANEKAGAIKIAKVNVDENQGLSSKFGIRAIPTLLFFKNGAVREQIVGMTSKRDLIAKLEALA